MQVESVDERTAIVANKKPTRCCRGEGEQSVLFHGDLQVAAFDWQRDLYVNRVADSCHEMKFCCVLNPLAVIGDLVKWAMILVVRLYQGLVSPLLGRHCRFEPSCSEYFVQAVEKYGPAVGCWKGLKRIFRCHPWNPGGYDPP